LRTGWPNLRPTSARVLLPGIKPLNELCPKQVALPSSAKSMIVKALFIIILDLQWSLPGR
jgi:hypothetical protein